MAGFLQGTAAAAAAAASPKAAPPSTAAAAVRPSEHKIGCNRFQAHVCVHGGAGTHGGRKGQRLRAGRASGSTQACHSHQGPGQDSGLRPLARVPMPPPPPPCWPRPLPPCAGAEGKPTPPLAKARVCSQCGSRIGGDHISRWPRGPCRQGSCCRFEAHSSCESR